MANVTNTLTGNDLATPARKLPFKVLRDLGHMLYQPKYSCGNWETVAEDLGYNHEEIKQFSTIATVRQEVTPGELMLRDWVERANGRTLFVLHHALTNVDRIDCVQYLEKEIYNSVVCMNLMFCVKGEDQVSTFHSQVHTRAEGTLLDSLCNILERPVEHKYRLLDSGVSWTGTHAWEFKGRQLMLLKLCTDTPMEQDPTIDSSVNTVTSPITSDILPTVSIESYSREESRTSYQPAFTGMSQLTSLPSSPSFTTVTSTCARQLPQHSAVTRCTGTVTRSAASSFDNSVSITQGTEGSDRLRHSVSMGSVCSYTQCYQGSTCASIQSTNNLNLPTEHQSPNTSDPMNIHINRINNVSYLDSSVLRSLNTNSTSDASVISAPLPCIYTSFSNDNNIDVSYGQLSSECDEKPLNILNKMEDDDDEVYSDSGKCFSIADRESDSVEYRDPAEFAVLSYNVAEYQDPEISQDTIDDSLTCVKQRVGESELISQTDEKYQQTRESSSIHDDHDDSITHLKQFAHDQDHSLTDVKKTFNIDGSESTVYKQTGGMMMRVYDETCENINTSSYSPDCDSKYREDDEYKGDFVAELGSNSSENVPGGSYGIGENCTESQRCRSVCDETDFYHFDPDNVADSVKESNGLRLPVGVPIDRPSYLDFNDFNQGCSASQRQDCKMEEFGPVRSRSNIKLPKRSINRKAGGTRCHVPCTRKSEPYESLKHSSMCQSDIFYEGNTNNVIDVTEENGLDIPVIAEVFSPVKEKFKIVDFKSKQEPVHNSCIFDTCGFDFDRSTSSGNTESRSSHDSITGHTLVPMAKRTKVCHSVQVKSQVHFQPEDVEVDLVSRRHSSPPTGPRQTRHQNAWKPALPPRDMRHSPRSSPHQYDMHDSRRYMHVIAGSSKRPSLDSMLANDQLFVHYNKILRSYPSWSPRETENTIDKTMATTLSSNGCYILWYSRTKKNLVIGISYCGALLHYRVHTKVIKDQLHYYINHSDLFADVISLLHYYKSHGLGVTGCHRNTGREENYGYRVYMSCPVVAQYERQPAISV